MSLINRALNAFAAWAVARGKNVNPDPGVRTDAKPAVWGYTITDYLDGGPYLTRILFPRVFGFRPMLHKFHRPDGDRALHNHPWSWACSLILRGSYTEERRLDEEQINGTDAPRVETKVVRWFNYLTDRDFHRVTELHGEEVWTLFVTGPRTQSWGFDEHGDGHVTDWREYIDRKKAEHAERTAQVLESEFGAGETAGDTLFADLQRASGADLDALAETMFGMKRRVTYKIVRTLSVPDKRDTDEEFRARIQRAILGE